MYWTPREVREISWILTFFLSDQSYRASATRRNEQNIDHALLAENVSNVSTASGKNKNSRGFDRNSAPRREFIGILREFIGILRGLSRGISERVIEMGFPTVDPRLSLSPRNGHDGHARRQGRGRQGRRGRRQGGRGRGGAAGVRMRACSRLGG